MPFCGESMVLKFLKAVYKCPRTETEFSNVHLKSMPKKKKKKKIQTIGQVTIEVKINRIILSISLSNRIFIADVKLSHMLLFSLSLSPQNRLKNTFRSFLTF